MEERYNLKIYPKAQKDMEEIFNYISDKLQAEESAKKLIDEF